MPTQNVNLTPELDSFVKAQVESGHYNSASEVHRAALSSLAKSEEEREIKLQALRGELAEGIADLEAGNYTEVSTEKEHRALFDRIRQSAVDQIDP